MAKVTIHLDLDEPDDQLLLNFISKKSEISCFLFELMTSNFKKKIENIEESLLYYPESKYKDWDKEKKIRINYRNRSCFRSITSSYRRYRNKIRRYNLLKTIK